VNGDDVTPVPSKDVPLHLYLSRQIVVDQFEAILYRPSFPACLKHSNINVMVHLLMAQGSHHLYLSVLGMPGMTAYTGLLQIGQPQSGETVVVSAVKYVVFCLPPAIPTTFAPLILAICPTTEPTAPDLTDELGFDAAIDYKQDDFAQQLEAAVPDGIDVYFENVGGAISDEVYYMLKLHHIPERVQIDLSV
jgi:NADPH-dependent curcumin reductase CurA